MLQGDQKIQFIKLENLEKKKWDLLGGEKLTQHECVFAVFGLFAAAAVPVE